jgi:acyl-CoA dehydrogenase
MPDRSFLTWPFFETKHRELAEKLDAWCASKAPVKNERDVDSTCLEWVKSLAKGGWLNYATPDPNDNRTKIEVRSLCLIRETLARHSGLADFSFAMQGLGAGPIALFGSQSLKSKYLADVRDGSKIAAFALSEAEAGSDVAAISTTATKSASDYVIDGSKSWISNAGLADFYVVYARTGEAPGAKGLSAFVVDADTAGLRVSERTQVIAPHPLGTLKFSGCRVPAANMLGAPGEGFKIAMSTLDIFRPTVGAAALGFGRRALDESACHGLARNLFGKPLADMQMTQAKLADMATKVDAAALLIYRAAWAKDSGANRITREASMAKLYTTEAMQEVIDMAVQLFGARGVLSGEPVEALYREIRALRIYEGASEVQRQIIAKMVLAGYQEKLLN